MQYGMRALVGTTFKVKVTCVVPPLLTVLLLHVYALITQIDYVKEVEPVMLQIREKKKWKKYPCTVRNDCFIQFKDSKVSHPTSN